MSVTASPVAVRTALRSAVVAIDVLGGCMDHLCAEPACWLGCLDDDSRAVVRSVMAELGFDL